MKKFILLDIDNTLYDSSTFRKKLFKKVIMLLERANIGNAKEICESTYKQLISEKGLFYPEDFIQALKKQLSDKSLPEKELLTVMYDEKFASEYLYDETHMFIKEFSALGELGIFSQGMEQFQKLKIKQISHLFKDHHVHIVQNKTNAFQTIFKNYENHNVFFLDDSLPILHAVKKVYPSTFVIWIKRGIYAANQEPIEDFLPDATVVNLKEAERIIKEN